MKSVIKDLFKEKYICQRFESDTNVIFYDFLQYSIYEGPLRLKQYSKYKSPETKTSLFSLFVFWGITVFTLDFWWPIK